MCCQMSHNWDGVGNTFSYKCLIGNAIEGIWTRRTQNKCALQAGDPRVPHWTYNESVPVPGCIRKQLEIIHKLCFTFSFRALFFVLKCIKSLLFNFFGLLNIINLWKNQFFINFFYLEIYYNSQKKEI